MNSPHLTLRTDPDTGEIDLLYKPTAQATPITAPISIYPLDKPKQLKKITMKDEQQTLLDVLTEAHAELQKPNPLLPSDITHYSHIFYNKNTKRVTIQHQKKPDDLIIATILKHLHTLIPKEWQIEHYPATGHPHIADFQIASPSQHNLLLRINSTIITTRTGEEPDIDLTDPASIDRLDTVIKKFITTTQDRQPDLNHNHAQLVLEHRLREAAITINEAAANAHSLDDFRDYLPRLLKVANLPPDFKNALRNHNFTAHMWQRRIDHGRCLDPDDLDHLNRTLLSVIGERSNKTCSRGRRISRNGSNRRG